uniref:Uncharacterized protein n=1 Tax=Peronospora matthiolae TaxID=2874970 RepID=A0AAV1U6A6_9STRA
MVSHALFRITLVSSKLFAYAGGLPVGTEDAAVTRSTSRLFLSNNVTFDEFLHPKKSEGENVTFDEFLHPKKNVTFDEFLHAKKSEGEAVYQCARKSIGRWFDSGHSELCGTLELPVRALDGLFFGVCCRSFAFKRAIRASFEQSPH